MEKLDKKTTLLFSLDAYYKRSSIDKYTAEERVDSFHDYLRDLTMGSANYRENKNELFAIIEQTVNEVLPKRVFEQVKNFAEFKNVPQNTTIKFRVKNKKIKAVVVALGGHVKRVRVDQGSFTMKVKAIECAVYEEYERIISGLVDWTDLINGVIESITTKILEMVHTALIGIYEKLPAANKATALSSTFDQSAFDKIINTVKAYGQPIIIGTPVGLSQLPIVCDEDKSDIRNMGYIGKYKGCSCVELVNSFEDETNAKPIFDDKYIFIIPSGQEKVVKVAMEGGLVVEESTGEDRTRNYDAYQKAGVGILAVNNIGMYKSL